VSAPDDSGSAKCRRAFFLNWTPLTGVLIRRSRTEDFPTELAAQTRCVECRPMPQAPSAGNEILVPEIEVQFLIVENPSAG